MSDDSWGPVPKPQEFNALGKQMKFKSRRERQSITPISPSFLCPTQALGLALQHRPILLVGSMIILIKNIMIQTITLMRQFTPCQSMYEYYYSIQSSLKTSPVEGGHLSF
jgi:hypothetical protein